MIFQTKDKRGRIIIFLLFCSIAIAYSQKNPVENYYINNHLGKDAKVAFVLLEKHDCLDCLKNMPLIENDLLRQKYRVQYIISFTRRKFLNENFVLLTNLEPESRLISNDTQLYSFLNDFNKQLVVKYNGLDTFSYVFCKNYFEETIDTIVIDESKKEFKFENMVFKVNDSTNAIIDHYFQKEIFLLSTKSGMRDNFVPEEIDSIVRLAYYSNNVSKSKYNKLIKIFNEFKKNKTYTYLNPESFNMNDSEFMFIYQWARLRFINDSDVISRNDHLIVITNKSLKVKKYYSIKDSSFGDYYIDIFNDNYMYNDSVFIFKLRWLQNTQVLPKSYFLGKYTISGSELLFSGLYRNLQEPKLIKRIHAEYYLDDVVFIKANSDTFYIFKSYPYVYKFGDTSFMIEITHKADFSKFATRNDLIKDNKLKFNINSVCEIDKNIYISCYEDGVRTLLVFDLKFQPIKSIKIKCSENNRVFDFDDHSIRMLKQDEDRSILYTIPY